MVLQDRHESLFIGDIVEEVGKKLDSTALLVPCIDWHRHRLLVKRTKMILSSLYLIGLLTFYGLFLYKFISAFLLAPRFDFGRTIFNGYHDRVWEGFGLRDAGAEQDSGLQRQIAGMLEQNGIAGTKKVFGVEAQSPGTLVLDYKSPDDQTLKDFARFGIELLPSAGTKKYIETGIEVMCSLVLAFCLS
ncbi:disease resistance protein [Salix suchowensis]|nr:disease resistance protein [Salix suchowensis]